MRLTRGIAILAFGALLAGCEGPPGADGMDGADGADGADGTEGTDGTDGTDGEDGEDLVNPATALDFVISGVDTSGGNPVVSFTVADQDGRAFEGITQETLTSRGFRWSIAKLVPGSDGDADYWQSYINHLEEPAAGDPGPGGTPALTSALQAEYELDGTLEVLGDGAYTYTYNVDVSAVTDPVAVSFDEDYLHRVAFQLSVEDASLNGSYDWVPSGGDAPVTKAVYDMASCNECHGELTVHGSRYLGEYCVVCHNPGSTDAHSGNNVDMAAMTHAIHFGHELENGYTIWGYRNSEHDYSHVGFPMAHNHCLKCHNPDDESTPDAGNFRERPTMTACGACHEGVDFSGAGDHPEQTDNSSCSMCHGADSIDEYHATENSSPNNPQLPEELSAFEYEIVSAEMDGDDLVVEFSIYKDGVAFDVEDLPSDMSDGRYAGFRLMYALPQGHIEEPADWNNYGMSAAQPSGPDVNEADELSYNSSTGVHTATIYDAYPDGATLRAVAIQGYFYELVDDEEVGRHTLSVYTNVDGYDARREITDPEKCGACHEWFEGHGGNRLVGLGGEGNVCAICHVPNLSSSGTTLDLDNPEAVQNLKDLLHGIHGASMREYPLDFVRSFRGSARPYTFIGHDHLDAYPDGHVVAYPTDASNCLMCHNEGTYMLEAVPMGALESTDVTGALATSPDDVGDARDDMPNDDDLVISPLTAACVSCHDSDAAQAHMEHNGGAVRWFRADYYDEAPYEACSICHGAGRSADVEAVHGL